MCCIDRLKPQPKADMAMLLQDFTVDIGDHPDYILAVIGEALLVGRNCRSALEVFYGCKSSEFGWS